MTHDEKIKIYNRREKFYKIFVCVFWPLWVIWHVAVFFIEWQTLLLPSLVYILSTVFAVVFTIVAPMEFMPDDEFEGNG